MLIDTRKFCFFAYFFLGFARYVMLRSRIIAILTFVFTLAGCATGSLFSAYPTQAVSFQQAVTAKAEADKTLKNLDGERTSTDAMLYMMERGRIGQLNSRFTDSKNDFELVIEGFEEQDMAAAVALSEVGVQGASLLSNDNAIPYKGSGYERVFVHHHQAFNYLGEHDLEGAAIEFRKVALEQQVLLEKHEDEVADAYESAEENSIDVDKLSQEFSGLDTIAGNVKSSFQNAYTFYASAAFWEATGEFNSALVDYKKAFEINSDNNYLPQDISRVSKKLGENPDRKDLNEAKENEGTVVVFFEEGFVAPKSEIHIAVPTFGGEIYSIAFPYYATESVAVSPSLRVTDNKFNELGVSELVVDVTALAVKDLVEQVPELIVRQVLRAHAKHKLQEKAGNIGGDWMQLATNIYNIVSENADRRSWLTLPNTAQVMRFNLSAGKRELSLSAASSKTKLSLDIDAKKTTFVRSVHANNQLVAQVYEL